MSGIDNYETSSIMKRGIKSEKRMLKVLNDYPTMFKEFGEIKYVQYYGDYNKYKWKQDRAIDVEILKKDERGVEIISIDVKYDDYLLNRNKNILCEWWICERDKPMKPGWGQTGQCDYLMWDCEKVNKIVITHKDEFLKQKDKYLNDYPNAKMKFAWTKGTNKQKWTLNWCMPYEIYGTPCSTIYEM